MTSGVMHVRLSSYRCMYVRTQLQRICVAILLVVYSAYTIELWRSACLLSRDSHVTFPTVVTVSIVRGSIFFVLMNPCHHMYLYMYKQCIRFNTLSIGYAVYMYMYIVYLHDIVCLLVTRI